MVKSTYLKYGSAHLQLPEFMVGIGKDHKKHLYNSTTKTGRLAYHDGVSAVVLDKLPKGNHIKTVKGAIEKYTQKAVKASKAIARANTATAELQVAENAVRIAKTRGRKPLTQAQKDERALLKANEKAMKKEEKEAKKQTKAIEKEAMKQAKAMQKELNKQKKKKPNSRTLIPLPEPLLSY